MGTKLTFKQYLESKEKLREAVSNTPQRAAKYAVRKYCKLVVGESKDSKEYVNLKPKQTILVEWLYDDIDDPTVVNIKFEDVKNVDSSDEYETFWTGERFQKWLLRNTREEN